MEEIWKDVVGYEGLYEVSNFGEVRSVDRTTSNGRKLRGKLRSTHKINGYIVVQLFKNGKLKNYKVHRLVAMAFIPNKDNKPCIDHIDTDRTNNKVDNLKWCTYKENYDNPLSSEAQKNAVRKKFCIPIKQYDTNGIFIKSYPSTTTASQETKIHSHSISECLRNRRKTAGGYVWKYAK